MSGATDRLALYLSGGGSSEEFVDEVVDIDNQNNNFEIIDAAMGAPGYTSTSRPLNPFPGQLIWETDTSQMKRWNSTAAQWDAVFTAEAFPDMPRVPFVQETEPTGAETGDLWFW